MTSAWSEEKTVNKLKSALIQAVIGNGGPVSQLFLLKQFKDTYGVEELPVQKFGCNNLTKFMEKYTMYFTRVGNSWTYNESGITENDRDIIKDMQQVKGGSKRGRGGISRGNANRGRGSANRGGYGSGFNSNVPSLNNGFRPGFSRTAPIVQSNPSSNNFRNNDPPYQNFSSQHNDSYQNSFNQDKDFGDFDRTRNNYNSNNTFSNNSRPYNDDYTPHVPSPEYHANSQTTGYGTEDYDYYQWNDPNRNTNARRVDDPRRTYDPLVHRSPPPNSSLANNSNRTFTASISPPPGLQPKNSRPYSAAEREHISPPPGFVEQNPSSQHGSSQMGTELTVGNIVAEVIIALQSLWPRSCNLKDIFNCLPKSEIANRIAHCTPEVKEKALLSVKKRLTSKEDFKKLVHVSESSGETLLMYIIPIDGNSDEMKQFVFNVVANLIKEHGQMRLSPLSKILGIEGRGGLIPEAILFEMLVWNANFKKTFLFEAKGAKIHGSLSLVEGASFEFWRPPITRIVELKTQDSTKSSSPQFRSLSTPLEREPEDPMLLLQMAQERLIANSVNIEYFKPGYLPLFYQLARNPDCITHFWAKVTNYVDLNNFWVRTEEDNDVYNQLTDALSQHYHDFAPSDNEIYTPREGEMVAATVYFSRSDFSIIRGIVIEKTREWVLLRNIDEGSTRKVYMIDLMKLPEYFNKLPPLATRCSVGKFKMLSPDEERQLADEEQGIGQALLGCCTSFRIRQFVPHEHVVVELDVPWGDKILNIPQEFISIMADL